MEVLQTHAASPARLYLQERGLDLAAAAFAQTSVLLSDFINNTQHGSGAQPTLGHLHLLQPFLNLQPGWCSGQICAEIPRHVDPHRRLHLLPDNPVLRRQAQGSVGHLKACGGLLGDELLQRCHQGSNVGHAQAALPPALLQQLLGVGGDPRRGAVRLESLDEPPPRREGAADRKAHLVVPQVAKRVLRQGGNRRAQPQALLQVCQPTADEVGELDNKRLFHMSLAHFPRLRRAASNTANEEACRQHQGSPGSNDGHLSLSGRMYARCSNSVESTS
mmetsp:Transcript_19530/g.56715  ORF Transcript_19530/g.56715 Transcript_19530/m.56715 type:complete len:276 (+) Transcript_19530:620-1447(+)